MRVARRRWFDALALLAVAFVAIGSAACVAWARLDRLSFPGGCTVPADRRTRATG